MRDSYKQIPYHVIRTDLEYNGERFSVDDFKAAFDARNKQATYIVYMKNYMNDLKNSRGIPCQVFPSLKSLGI